MLQANWIIRPFTLDDYPGIAESYNAAHPDQTTTTEELRELDEKRQAFIHFLRLVAEMDGRIVASGHYTQIADSYHPQKFWFDESVHPEYRGQGIGSAIYDRLLEALAPFDPLSLRADVPEDMAAGIQFLQKRGFQEDGRTWESHLDLASFDLAPYAGLEESLRAQGIEIKTRKELEVDPERNRKLYELDRELNGEVPLPPDETYTPFSFDYFVKNWMNNPSSLEDAYVVAVVNGEYVGEAALWKKPDVDYLIVDLTGVKREYRRKGIALAMKLRGIAFAKSLGYKSLRTWNDTYNPSILAVNERLGFVRQRAIIHFVKRFRTE